MGNMCRKGEPFNPGAGLDKVVASAEPACLLYTMANFKKGGQLIDAFNKGGSTGVSFFSFFLINVFIYRLSHFLLLLFQTNLGVGKDIFFDDVMLLNVKRRFEYLVL